MMLRTTIPFYKAAGASPALAFPQSSDAGNATALPVMPSAFTGWKRPAPRAGLDWRTPNPAPQPAVRTGAFEPTTPKPLGIPVVAKMATQIDKPLRAAIAQAEADTAVPTDAQRESGNYKKGKFTWNGLGVTIETAKGQTRSGTAKDGTKWGIVLKNSYGYIRGTDSAEPGDQMDVFIGPSPESEVVYVVDQNKADGKTFDEHKAIVAAVSSAQAKQIYHDNYSAGWKGFRNITALTLPQFKNWLKHGAMDKPLNGQEFAKFHKHASVKSAADIDWAGIGQKVREQMPGFHGYDSAAGALAAALPTYAMSATSKNRKTRDNRWRNTLLAGLGGGFAANLAGDRARRYISNLPGAFGYQTSSMTDPALRAGLKGVWQGAVLDQPITPTPSDRAYDADNPGQWKPGALPRRELLRRALGVHAPTNKDFFSSTGSSAHGGRLHDRLEFAARMFQSPSSDVLNKDGEKLFEQSVQPEGWQAMNNILQGNAQTDDSSQFDGNTIGSSIFGNLPMRTIGDSRQMRDVWDFDWSPQDASAFKQVAGGVMRHPTSLFDPFENAGAKDTLLRNAGDKVVHNSDILKSLLARKVLNNVLVKSAPVFEQNFVRPFDAENPESTAALRMFRSPTVALPDDASIGRGLAVGAGVAGAGGLLDWMLRKNTKPRAKVKRQRLQPSF
jgi:hypothetical protein